MAETTHQHRYSAALAGEIELAWQARWDAERTFYSPNPSGPLAEPNAALAARPSLYVLDMFPYPSGSGLHVGHPLGYIGTDVYARFKRMDGFNVLHAMGYDAFGLPAERYAMDTGRHPAETTAENVANMRRQLRRLGLGHDPRRSIETTDVGFYRWTQWIFTQIHESFYDADLDRARPIADLVAAFESGERDPAEGPWATLSPVARAQELNRHRLAYLAEVEVNWCPELGTVLANEEVTADGRSEIGGFPVFKRPLRQWIMRITAYADRLVQDLSLLDWPDSLKLMQTNWVGRSVGAEVAFDVAGRRVGVFTTRPDTLPGVTFLAVAPEHPLAVGALPEVWPEDTPMAWRGPEPDATGPADAVARYRARSANLGDRVRQVAREASGAFSGLTAAHPLTGEELPVFVVDYVLMGYGEGAVMGVPAHDERDFRFARLMDLPIERVVAPPVAWLGEHGLAQDAPARDWPSAYTGPGQVVIRDAAGERRVEVNEAKEAVVAQLEAAGSGSPRVEYKLRDWLFSRQRYWGEPFPIVYGEDGEPRTLPDGQLPVLLPELDDFKPTGTDDMDSEPQPPLGRATDWVHVTLDLGDGPKPYRRETNTMPQWAGSCWYYLRYLDPENTAAFVDPDIERYWTGGTAGGVDLYVGGAEHAVLHLLYSRFWHKVLFDLGHVSTPEPFQRLFNQGMVQAEAFTDERGFYVDATQVVRGEGGPTFDGKPVERHYGKMGKSLKNGVTPDEIYADYGADALRLYELFAGPLDQPRPWNTEGIVGVVRFLQRLWRLVIDEETGAPLPAAPEASREQLSALHRTIAQVRRDMDALRFNTAIAALMELLNELTKDHDANVGLASEIAEPLVLMVAPFAPHFAEELWQRLGHADTLAYVAFPTADEGLMAVDAVDLVVQVNGKRRAQLSVPVDASKDDIVAAARAHPNVASHLEGTTERKTIVVPGRLVNFVVG